MDYQLLVNDVIKACENKDAFLFSSLFSNDGVIILNNNSTIYKEDIETVTKTYFDNLKYIKIHVKSLIIQENKAFIEWSWLDYNLITNKENNRDNLIILDFKNNSIDRWQEYNK
ncbi:nuclear transport factor 2 family protein [Geminocystis sp. CENA526]|uniref:nuclear transport factor 2 family protein n=1 Tax=Geminocystis sp. CENA526 TaxID=1355871 RepID=UPI003D6E0F90